MKKAILILSLAAVPLFATTASADDETPGSFTTKTVVIVGRPNKPSVVIELTRPTAARAAGAAHEELRQKMIESMRPVTLVSHN
jgi:hypothetical protein